ncbi:Inositol-pentakisphosphate 2-kinase [Tulasnella sp. 419]|nr:Inositol-pentakisphosphate 2-kinase [Tulasnella sp. 419]
MATPVTLADVTLTSPEDWSYISEGGATIVFSYAGPNHPEFSGTVLRLRKIEIKPPPKEIFKPLDIAEGVNETSSESESDGETSSDDDEPDDPTIAFQSKITSKIIPPKHLPRLEPVKLRRRWLERLAKLGEKDRPEARKTVDNIDVKKTKGVLATDLVGRSGWAVEIKPKWAFLPNPQHLSPRTKDTKLKHCRFCMHTHQRSIKSPKKYVSQYCPLDLYSGDEDRIRKAVAALWDAWIGSNGSLNNLKIFINGSAITPDDTSAISKLQELLGQPIDGKLKSVLPAFTNALIPMLRDTELLTSLAALQRTLDPLDIEGVARLWSLDSDEQTPPSPIGQNAYEVTLKEWEKFLKEYLSQMQCTNDAASLEKIQQEWNDPPIAKLRYYMLAYLLSATFKDCSFMIRFPARSLTATASTTTSAPTITAIDLDPKSVTRLAKWEELDREIVDCFIETGYGDKRICVDAKAGVPSNIGKTKEKKEQQSLLVGAVVAVAVALSAAVWFSQR